MESLRKFLSSPQGLAAGVVVVLLGLVAAGMSLKKNMTAYNPTGDDRVMMDSGTNPPTPFHVSVVPGKSLPAVGPSGKPAVPAEECYWTKDGKPKTEPTYVLVEEAVGRPGPTFCPECGRLVTQHNRASDVPPITKDEWLKRQAARASKTGPTPADAAADPTAQDSR
jgi:hypothetical protein